MNRSKSLPFRLILLMVVLIVGIIASSHDIEAAQRYCPIQWAASCGYCQWICANADCAMLDCIWFEGELVYCGCG